MEQASEVLSATVEVDGEARTATYFVEHNLINAMIEGRLVIRAVKKDSPARTVRELLIQELLR